MTPGKMRSVVLNERIAWIRQMIKSIHDLPMSSFAAFTDDARTPAAAESYLRRGIEALLDMGRHILAKGFAVAVTEYKEIGPKLVEEGILSENKGHLLRQIAGYRNRMVHFYHDVSKEELFRLCTSNLKDIELILDGLIAWSQEHPEKIDQKI